MKTFFVIALYQFIDKSKITPKTKNMCRFVQYGTRYTNYFWTQINLSLQDFPFIYVLKNIIAKAGIMSW